jgi:tetratricopeptide (TPR) repeat protein
MFGSLRRTSPVLALLGTLAPALQAQVIDVRPVTPPAVTTATDELRAAQEGFETTRRRNAPSFPVRTGPGRCDEVIGRFCYWYEEDAPEPPDEPLRISAARERLLQQLDSVGTLFPNDQWISGQRVRYYAEAERYDDAIRSARQCVSADWWCPALRGFAFHVAGRYEEADSAYEQALARMEPADRCSWRDLKILLDDNQLRRYREMNCEQRHELEDRIWWLARPMLSGHGNDARTEYYSRLMYALFIEDAQSAYAMGFDSDEKELTLRYGWSIAWTRSPEAVPFGAEPGLVGHERVPAHPFLPVRSILDNPATSDSAGWRSKGIPPVHARYAPAYARRLLALDHQSGLFRRGDSALVVVAWSVAGDQRLGMAARNGKATSALVLTRGEQDDAAIARAAVRDTSGRLMAKTAWGSMLMSAEITAPGDSILARARYGVRRTDSPASRIEVSDIVLYEPYDDTPKSAEEALPHMLTAERVQEGARVGIFWEAYQVDPRGEGIDVSITVVPENTSGGGWLQRGMRALRRVREAQPVTVGMRDFARGEPVTARAVEVDLSTLTPGRYLLQLELDAGPGAVIQVTRAVTVVKAGG